VGIKFIKDANKPHKREGNPQDHKEYRIDRSNTEINCWGDTANIYAKKKTMNISAEIFKPATMITMLAVTMINFATGENIWLWVTSVVSYCWFH
jgi:hypothetical protein